MMSKAVMLKIKIMVFIGRKEEITILVIISMKFK